MWEASGRSFLLGMSRYLQAAAPPLASPVELLAAAGHPSAAVLLVGRPSVDLRACRRIQRSQSGFGLEKAQAQRAVFEQLKLSHLLVAASLPAGHPLAAAHQAAGHQAAAHQAAELRAVLCARQHAWRFTWQARNRDSANGLKFEWLELIPPGGGPPGGAPIIPGGGPVSNTVGLGGSDCCRRPCGKRLRKALGLACVITAWRRSAHWWCTGRRSSWRSTRWWPSWRARHIYKRLAGVCDALDERWCAQEWAEATPQAVSRVSGAV